MARLCGISTEKVQSDRVGTASGFARDFDTVVVLKGAQTLVCLPDGRTMVCPTGNPGMASGGMGDVLTGMIAGFCAQGLAPEQAAVCGVYIHGLCADLLAKDMGRFGFLATDLILQIPGTIHSHIL
jgi:NAD(P)H-hydrate epimerase